MTKRLSDYGFAEKKLMEAMMLPNDTPNKNEIIQIWETNVSLERMAHNAEVAKTMDHRTKKMNGVIQ